MYLGNHHVTVKRPFAVRRIGPLDVRPDLRDDGGAEGQVRDEVAVHDVDVHPVAAPFDAVAAAGAQAGKVGGEDGGRYDGGGGHGGEAGLLR